MMQTDTVLTQDSSGASDATRQPPKIEGARKGFVVNVVSNIAFTGTQMVLSLWFTPYLISMLGVAAYGMWPLVNTLMVYLGVFTDSFNSAVSRFLTVDLVREDERTANRTFNTALFGTIAVVLILAPVALIAALVFPYLFDVPPGQERDASLLFGAVAISFFISVIGSNFAVSSYAHSKFLLRNVVNIGALLVRIGLVVVLFTFLAPRLWQIGAGALLAALVSLLGFAILWHRLTPQLHIQISSFDRSRLRSLTGMGGWIMVDRVGSLLLKRVDLIVVNMVFGAAMTGKYGAVSQFPTLINSLAMTASTVTNPVIMGRYAVGDLAGLKRLSYQAVKLLGLGLALPVGLLCGFAHPLLTIWLGSSFGELAILLVFMVAHLTLNLSAMPLGYVNGAMNRVRWPATATVIAGVANVGLGILLATWGGLGVLGVALAGGIVWTAKNTLFFPIYTAHILKLPWWTFLPCLGAGVIGTLSVGLMSYGTTLVRMPGSWFTLAVSAAVVSLVYVAGVAAIGLNRSDRQLLMDLLPRPGKS